MTRISGCSARTALVASIPDKTGHSHVHDDGIGQDLGDELHRLPSILRLSDHLDIGLFFQRQRKEH